MDESGNRLTGVTKAFECWEDETNREDGVRVVELVPLEMVEAVGGADRLKGKGVVEVDRPEGGGETNRKSAMFAGRGVQI